jgi:predicted transcriptional regulator
MDIFYKVFSQVKVNDFCLVHRHHLNSDAIQDKILVKKIRQFCLLNEQNNLPPGYTQEQLAEVLGVDQSLVSRAFSKAAAQLSPLTNKPSKRQKRSDAFEVQHAAVVVVIREFWVRLYTSCTYQTMVKTKFTTTHFFQLQNTSVLTAETVRCLEMCNLNAPMKRVLIKSKRLELLL